MRKFTAEDDAFLLNNYLTIPAKRMSAMLNRSESCAPQRMKLLGITVPAEVIEKFRKESQFRKGHVSFNKGHKQTEYMSSENIERSKATRFKKGNTPHNTRYDGHERLSKDGYIEIRIKLGKYVLKHRHIWEQANGKVPKGKCLIFIDGDTQHITLENLKLITRKENMLRNSVHNYPEDIAKAMQLRGALNRQINKHIKKLRNEK